MKRGYIIILILFVFFTSCEKTVKPVENKRGVISKNAMVVSARAEASEIALDNWNKGGNAFDAMIATEMALAVAYPYDGKLGGGGFMVYRKAKGETGVL